jgi:hypothetical protein
MSPAFAVVASLLRRTLVLKKRESSTGNRKFNS